MAIKHTVENDGLSITAQWFQFRTVYNVHWKDIRVKNGKSYKRLIWPEELLEFFKDNSVTHERIGNGKYARTPDGRTVEMKDIIFHFPSKDIAALFKLSYL